MFGPDPIRKSQKKKMQRSHVWFSTWVSVTHPVSVSQSHDDEMQQEADQVSYCRRSNGNRTCMWLEMGKCSARPRTPFGSGKSHGPVAAARLKQLLARKLQQLQINRLMVDSAPSPLSGLGSVNPRKRDWRRFISHLLQCRIIPPQSHLILLNSL